MASSVSNTGGKLRLFSDGANVAAVKQEVPTASPRVRHGLDIVIERGPVWFRCGSLDGYDDYITETRLGTGTHRLSFIPLGLTVTATTASFWVEFWSLASSERVVASIAIAPSGDMVLPTPWAEADLPRLKFAQSADVLFVTSGKGIHQRIERRGAFSWSITSARVTDGPFLTQNTNEQKTLTPSVKIGNGTLTASRPIFKAGHIGSMWQLTHSSQTVAKSLAGPDQFTDPIRVTGLAPERTIKINITNGWVGSLTLQRSVGNPDNWIDTAYVYSANAVTSYADGYDNQLIYYRLGFKGSDFTSGTADVELTFAGGITIGRCLVTKVVSRYVCEIEVIKGFGNTTPSTEWAEGAWSDQQFWPRAICLSDGRLMLGDADLFWGSVSNAFESFKIGENAADAISRAVATGDMNRINWLMALNRLIAGTGGAVAQIKASALDEPITPTNLTVHDISTMGVADVEPAKIDNRAVFVDRSGWRVSQLSAGERGELGVSPLMRLHRYIGKPGINQLAVARQPDTRVFMVRADGQLLCLLYDPSDNAIGWSRLITDGIVESVEVLPGPGEDRVFVMVRRTIGGVQKRFLERFDPMLLEAASAANTIDSYVRYDGATPITELTGLGHLEGRQVVVWADKACYGRLTVAGGKITLPKPLLAVRAGLPYTGSYRASKLAYAAQAGTSVNQQKRLTHIGLLLLDALPGALEYGTDFETMDRLADRSLALHYDAGPGLFSGESDQFPVPGGHGRDKRLCLRATSEGGPVTVQGFVLGLTVNERI
jgi:hypothetical protein